ncbi:uncharacterized protein LOC106463837 [Limulus polyphemus]|uniref:Uncharacterized protein LOC106463837 n=1 Tax=Limulus polyphemus TaxID=6850 RepID=A0ABM1BCS3_LIMPO|nr:uncharacterized protein LOC106463837 [Limulus polyphemus]
MKQIWNKQPQGPQRASRVLQIFLKVRMIDQNSLANFPKSHGRRFNADWCVKHEWIEYSVCEDKMYCFVCRHFSTARVSEESAFVSDDFNSRKKCTSDSYKNNRLLKHQKSEQHVDCTARYAAYKEAKQRKSAVAYLINEQYRETVRKNRKYIKTIADNLRLTAVQNIAQRGH